MKGVIIALALFAVSAYGQINCPDCPDPEVPPNCQVPDCTLPQNHQNHALFPHPDPNYYWQCAPGNTVGTWAAMARPCACGTVFNPFVFPPRCTFWFERTWQPICSWVRPPVLRVCDPWCPDCDGGAEVTQPTTTVSVPTTTTGSGCNCPCLPCIWWPCVPCNPCQC